MISYQTGAYALFFFLAFIIVVFSMLMLFARNFVHSAVYLAVVLLSFAGLYALLNAQFIALLQLFIYAGAITIVVVFVIMMTHAGVEKWDDLLQKQSWVAAVVVTILSVGLINTVTEVSQVLKEAPAVAATTEELALILFRNYAVPFELASVVLLVALIGAIYLAKEAEE